MAKRDDRGPDSPPLCPSAQADWEGGVVFGVVGGIDGEPLVAYLTEPQLATEEFLALASPVMPTEVFRIAAPCACGDCRHFDGMDCHLVKRITEFLPEVTDRLPPCRIRPNCRWWQQEGKAACLRCPQVVTDSHAPSEELRRAAEYDVA